MENKNNLRGKYTHDQLCSPYYILYKTLKLLKEMYPQFENLTLLEHLKLPKNTVNLHIQNELWKTIYDNNKLSHY